MSNKFSHRNQRRKPSKKYKSDWKGTFKGAIYLLIITSFILGLFFYSDIANYIKYSSYEGETVGTLISYHANTGMQQSHEGSRERVLNYEITYTFVVREKVYSKSIYLNAHRVDIFNLKQIQRGEKDLIVKYNIYNPYENTIVIE